MKHWACTCIALVSLLPACGGSDGAKRVRRTDGGDGEDAGRNHGSEGTGGSGGSMSGSSGSAGRIETEEEGGTASGGGSGDAGLDASSGSDEGGDSGGNDAGLEGAADTGNLDASSDGPSDSGDGATNEDSFLLLATETPFGGGTDGDVLRYLVRGTFGTVEALDPIPGESLHDPAGVAVWNGTTLYVANRWGNSGSGSIERIALDGLDFEILGSTNGNGLENCHQVAIDAAYDELFQTNWSAGVLSLFTIESSGELTENGVLDMPDDENQLGVAVRAADGQLFVSDYDQIRRFARNGDGSYAFVGYFGTGAGQQYHYMSFRNDELYIGAFTANEIERFSFDGEGVPVFKDATPANGALNAVFSPDGQEMFVANHSAGGIARYRYESSTDTWSPHGDTVETPVLGAVMTLPLAN